MPVAVAMGGHAAANGATAVTKAVAVLASNATEDGVNAATGVSKAAASGHGAY